VSVTARDLYFVLRVRDEASNVLTGVSRDILRIGAAAEASGKRAQAATLRQQAANARASGEARAEALRAAAAREREVAAQMRAAGATKQQIAAVDAQARAYARQAVEVQAATDKQVRSLRTQATALDAEAKKLEANVRGHQRLAQTLNDVSSAATMFGLALAGAGALATAALLSTVKAGIEYDRQVALTKTQTDGFAASLKDLGQEGKDVARQVAAPFEEMQSALYDIFSSTNANMAESKVLLTAFAKAAVAGQVSLQDSSRSTMAIMNAFKIPVKDVNMVLDKQFQLVRKGVGTYAQFSSVIGKLTPSAVRLGQNLDTMDATLIFLTRNGLSTASAVASAARAMDALANPKTTQKLDALGIKSRDVHGKFLPLIDILKNMRKYLLALPPPARAQALFDIFKSSGGTIQAKRFFDLILPTAKGAGNLDQFEQFLKDMKGSAGQFNQAYGTMADTVASKTQLLKNNFDILKVTIGQALEPAFKRLLDLGARIIGWFNKLTPEQQADLAKWALMAAAITTVTGVIVLIVAGVGALAAAMAALGLSLGAVVAVVGGVVAGLGLLTAAVIAAYKGSAPLRKLFSDIGKTFSDVWYQDILPFAQGVRDSFNKNLLPALESLWALINGKVIPVLDDLWNRFGTRLVKVIGETARILKDELSKGFQVVSTIVTKFLMPAISELTKLYNQHKGAVDKVLWALGQLVKWVLIVTGTAVFGTLLAGLALIVGAFVLVVKTISLVVGAFSRMVVAFKDAINWVGNLRQNVINAGFAMIYGLANKIAELIGKLRSLKDTIRNAVGSLGNILYNAGRSIVEGLINGIQSKLGALAGFLSGVGSFIASHKGPPAKDVKLLEHNGALIMRGLQNGMNSAVPSLQKQLKGVTGKIQTTVNANVNQSPVVPSRRRGTGDGRSVVVNVYTQEIRPEYHSQQLGQLMASTF